LSKNGFLMLIDFMMRFIFLLANIALSSDINKRGSPFVKSSLKAKSTRKSIN